MIPGFHVQEQGTCDQTNHSTMSRMSDHSIIHADASIANRVQRHHCHLLRTRPYWPWNMPASGRNGLQMHCIPRRPLQDTPANSSRPLRKFKPAVGSKMLQRFSVTTYESSRTNCFRVVCCTWTSYQIGYASAFAMKRLFAKHEISDCATKPF